MRYLPCPLCARPVAQTFPPFAFSHDLFSSGSVAPPGERLPRRAPPFRDNDGRRGFLCQGCSFFPAASFCPRPPSIRSLFPSRLFYIKQVTGHSVALILSIFPLRVRRTPAGTSHARSPATRGRFTVDLEKKFNSPWGQPGFLFLTNTEKKKAYGNASSRQRSRQWSS